MAYNSYIPLYKDEVDPTTIGSISDVWMNPIDEENINVAFTITLKRDKDGNAACRCCGKVVKNLPEIVDRALIDVKSFHRDLVNLWRKSMGVPKMVRITMDPM